MPTDIVTVQLTRESEDEKWGFQISGGKDQDSPLVISEVSKSCLILKNYILMPIVVILVHRNRILYVI